MIFIPVVGVEGSGHHMIMDLLSGEQNPTLSVNGLNDEFVRAWQGCSPSAWSEVKKRMDDLEKGGITHYLMTTSFPYNGPRDPLRRPDMRTLVYNPWHTRVIIMMRDLKACVRSGVRREFAHVNLQALIVEDNYRFIRGWLTDMQNEYFTSQKTRRSFVYRVFHYEDFQSNPYDVCADLAKYVGLAVNRAQLRQPHTDLLGFNAEALLDWHFRTSDR